MGAYGNVTCEWCGQSYWEQDLHECEPGHLRGHIKKLQLEVEKRRAFQEGFERGVEERIKGLKDKLNYAGDVASKNTDTMLRQNDRIEELEKENKALKQCNCFHCVSIRKGIKFK